jgi:hypothetical protein
MPSIHQLYQRQDSLEKGRHLIATQKIQKGQLIFVEKPLLSLQSLGNAHLGALVCRCCRAFIGGPDICLAVASGRVEREKVWDYYKEKEKDIDNDDGKENIDGQNCCQMVSCRNQCGELYCSQECENEMWLQKGHELMCTGLIPDPEKEDVDDDEINDNEECDGEKRIKDQLHPLLQFKVHAVQSNEIFIMVGDLVSTIVSLRRQQIESQLLSRKQGKDYCNTGSLEDILSPYFDFTLKPWWEVATEPLLSNPMMLSEVVHLNKTLRELCETSASLLKDAFTMLVNSDNESGQNEEKVMFCTTLKQAIDECVEKYDLFSELFFGKIIGSFEQNALGIRARHPLCRELIENNVFRTSRHSDILRCFQAAGMIEETNIDEKTNEDNAEGENTQDVNEEEDGWDDYTCDEIAEFIAGLQINEDGYNVSKQSETEDNDNKSEEDEEEGEEEEEEDCNDCDDVEDSGDDLDTIFTPLDGTAMYSTTCKMNHSCVPNVMAKYSYSCSGGGIKTRWGRDFPLVVSCSAITDIEIGEELCISYINSDLNYEDRSKALENYGFACNCRRCDEEMNSKISTNDVLSKMPSVRDVSTILVGEDDDPFGSEEEDEKDEQMSEADNNSNAHLAQLVENLNEALSRTAQSSIPMSIMASTIAFAIRLASRSLKSIDIDNQHSSRTLRQHLEDMVNALNSREYIKCLQAALGGEETSMRILYSNRGWPDLAYREAHRCLSIVAALVYAQIGNFRPALAFLDKVMIFGLSRGCIEQFIEYVQFHASSLIPVSALDEISTQSIPDYCEPALQELVSKQGLSAPIHFPIAELDVKDCNREQFNHYFSRSEPVVLRRYAASWPAIQNWRYVIESIRFMTHIVLISYSYSTLLHRQLNFFANKHGNRLIPVEKGVMSEEGGLKEQLMTIKEFASRFLTPSTKQLVWPLELSSHKSAQDSIAYLAQHPLFEQIPELLNDIEAAPSLCGEKGPSNLNAWIGTGGTRTPCHFDTYDNLLAQVIGAKYVRCFHPSQTSKLHVIKQSGTSYGSQGNMSAVDCEMEDFSAHPLAKEAAFEETILFPGDVLFIPSGYWHYVRSLSTSASVNFWF